MPTRRRRWIQRFLPLEICGTTAALSAAVVAYAWTSRVDAAVIAASVCEAIAFYVAACWMEIVRQRRVARHDRDPSHGTTVRHAVRNLVVEFGPAELIDTLFIRPAAMYAFENLTGSLVWGVVIGKLLTDVAFYTIAIPSHELRQRYLPDRQPSGRQHAPRTPFLSFDLNRLERMFQHFSSTFPTTTVHYAVKCNPHESVLTRLAAQGCKFEIASATELDMLTAIGVEPAEVLFSNPVKRSDDIRLTYEAGVRRFAVDSEMEVRKLAVHAPGSSVMIRIAAPADIHSEVPSEGKFGVDPTQACALALMATELGLEPYALAFHVGSQMLDPHAWEPAIAASGRIMRALEAENIRFRALDIGGGFPVHYDGEIVPPLHTYAKIIDQAMDEYLPYDVERLAEPGRVLVADSGTMVATVIGVAERQGKRWIHLDVGAFNGMMEALETANELRFPVTDSRHNEIKLPVHLTGPSCDSQDTILFDVNMSSDLAEGDHVYIHLAGAYTTSYASNFNGFDIPTLVERHTRSLRTRPLTPTAHHIPEHAGLIDLTDQRRVDISDQTAV